jgi:hypothetical protein
MCPDLYGQRARSKSADSRGAILPKDLASCDEFEASVRHQLAPHTSRRHDATVGLVPHSVARFDSANAIYGRDKSLEAGELELIKIDTGVQ